MTSIQYTLIQVHGTLCCEYPGKFCGGKFHHFIENQTFRGLFLIIVLSMLQHYA